MDEVKLAETLQDHKGRIGSLEHRMDNMEKLTESVNQLVNTTGQLAIEMRHTNESVSELKDHIEGAERRPAERLEQIKTAIISAVATAIIAAAIAAIINFM